MVTATMPAAAKRVLLQIERIYDKDYHKDCF